MLLRQLEYFCAVCERGSFTRAAEDHFVSQSAISQQVKSLESELGVRLLERKGRGFAITPAGQVLYRKGSDILSQLDDLRFEVEGVANGYATSLTVGYLNRYDGWEVQAAVAAFAARHPGIEINAVGGSHDELYRMVVSGEADLVFNDQRRELSGDFVNLHLMTGFGYVEMSEIDPLSGHDAVSVRDLKGRCAILIAAPEMAEVERTYYRDHLNFDCEFRFVGSREEGRMLVAGNHGFMPIEMRQSEGASGSIVKRMPLVDATGKQASQSYYAFWLKSRTSPLVEEFAEILKGLFA